MSRLSRTLLLAASAVLALGASCTPPPVPPGPIFQLRQVELGRGEHARSRVAVPGQLLRVGSRDLPYRFQGAHRLQVQRAGRAYRVNGRVSGIDITGLEPTAARNLLGQHPGAQFVIWREVERVRPALVRAIAERGPKKLGLWLGLALTAPRGLSLRALAPLCDRLQALVLEGEVRWSGVDALVRCPALTGLRVTTALPRGALLAISRLRSLRHLDLEGALLAFGPGPEGLRPLSRLHRLVTLDLGDNGLSDREIAPVSRLGELHWLRLRGNPLTGRTLGRLARLRRLAWLDLDDTALTNRGLSRLAGLRALRYLRLGHTRVSTRGLIAFHRARRHVTVLGREDMAQVQLGVLDHAPARRVPERLLSLHSQGPLTALSGLGTATGVASCDQFLRLLVCFFRAQPNARRGRSVTLIHKLRQRFARQLRTGGRAARTRLQRMCTQQVARFQRTLGKVPWARRCLKP